MYPIRSTRARVHRTHWAVPILLALIVPSIVQAQNRIRVEPHVGTFYNFERDVDTDNQWGGIAGVQLALPPSARHIYPTGTLGYLRTSSAYRTAFPNGGFVYAYEAIGATVGVGYDADLSSHTRVVLAAEAGIGGEREVETEQFGEPRPGQARGSGSFSFGPAGLLNLGVQQSLTRRFAAALTLRSYTGLGGILPTLTVGLVLR